MTCDDSRTYLAAYLDDELDVSDSLRLQKHLADCRDCQQDQDEQLVLRSALREPDLRAYPSPDFSKRIEAVVRQAAKEEAHTHDEQEIREDGPDKRGLHDDDFALCERNNSHNHLDSITIHLLV